MADYLSSEQDFTIDDGADDDDDNNSDGAVDDDNSSNGEGENRPDYLKKKLPYHVEEYMDKELKYLFSYTMSLEIGFVFWSRKDDEPECPPTLPDDILDFKKKIRDILSTTLFKWPDNTLVQFWAPITTSEGRSFLSTQNQPFALKSIYCDDDRDIEFVIEILRYRMMISKDYKFYMDLDGESSREEIGLPGRVFKHQFLECTPNLGYYSITEYPQRNDALIYFRQSLAIPVFERSTQRCVGVLEVVTPMNCFSGPTLILDYSYYNNEINEGFEKEGLKCSVAFDHIATKLDEDKNEACTIALGEIKKVLRMVCKVHDLPFAQAWVPCKVGWPCGALGDGGILGVRCQYSRASKFYRPGRYHTFRMVSRMLHLKKGMGVVGTTLSSPNMVFCRDVTQFSLTEYPLAHYARYDGLSGCFAICLQSSCSGNDVYVLEVFMPVSNQASEIPHTKLSKIWETMREKLHTFRFASGKELYEELHIDEIDNHGKVSVQMPQTTMSLPQSEPLQSGEEIMQVDSSYQQLTNGINNRSSVDGTERNNIVITCTEEEGTVKTSKRKGNKAGVKIAISLEDILQTSEMKLKDAAERLKVSKSTLKRVCRDYGYERWPPRNKAGCSQLNESTPCVNFDHLPPTRASATIVDTTMQDADMVTIKAKYGKDMIIKFRLSLSSRLVELQEQVAMRLNLESGTYYVKYKDDDSDLILIACDQDLQYYMRNSRSQGSTSIVVLLEPK